MKLPRLALGALCAVGCTTETVPLFVDGGEPPPDGTVVDTGPSEADAGEPDAEAGSDLGAPDSGVVRIRVCPKAISAIDRSRQGPDHASAYLELVAMPGWSWFARRASGGGLSVAYWHRPANGRPFTAPSEPGWIYPDEVGEPQLIPNGNGSITQVIPASEGTRRGVRLEMAGEDPPYFPTSVALASNEWVRDALQTPDAVILAVSSTVTSRLVRAHRPSRPRGAWVTRSSWGEGEVGAFRLTMAQWPVWWEVLVGAGDVGAIIETAYSSDGVDYSNLSSLCTNGLPTAFALVDVAAGDIDRMWRVTSCGGRMALTAVSRRPSLPTVDVPIARTVRAPTQLAYDGLVMTALDWPVDAARPRLNFFDARSTIPVETAELDFELGPEDDRVVAMDLAASPSADGLGTEYTAAFITHHRRRGLETTTLIFDGCRLE